jgi:ATP-dependent phosphofructokinase / diphosphate-dependent phosphofructokinase
MMKKAAPRNAFYAQSGGVTAVINASAAGLIEEARRHKGKIGKVYAGRHGIIGALTEDLIDVSAETPASIRALRHTPGGAFGSARYKLKGLDVNRAQYERLIEVFRAHDIGYFFYNGGNDSMDTANKMSQIATQLGYPLICIGIPKTVDNVMGRHAGWIAAAAGLAGSKPGDAPHIILFPEIVFDPLKFLDKVRASVETRGYCVVVVSEGVQNAEGKFLAEAGGKDAFGHSQLGGVGPLIAQIVKDALGYKFHWAVADYLQRAARHIAAKVDVEQAYAVGKAAVKFAVAGKNAVMPTIVRKSDRPYRWSIGEAPLAAVANEEKKVPRHYITADGFGITAAGRRYLAPLIGGEDYPPYKNGLPCYVELKGKPVRKRLKSTFVL